MLETKCWIIIFWILPDLGALQNIWKFSLAPAPADLGGIPLCCQLQHMAGLDPSGVLDWFPQPRGLEAGSTSTC